MIENRDMMYVRKVNYDDKCNHEYLNATEWGLERRVGLTVRETAFCDNYENFYEYFNDDNKEY